MPTPCSVEATACTIQGYPNPIWGMSADIDNGHHIPTLQRTHQTLAGYCWNTPLFDAQLTRPLFLPSAILHPDRIKAQKPCQTHVINFLIMLLHIPMQASATLQVILAVHTDALYPY